MNLGDILVSSGKITAEQWSHFRANPAHAGADPDNGQALVDEGLITAGDLLMARSRLYHLDILEDISPEDIDSSLVSRLPVDWARHHLILPLRCRGEVVAVMADPASLTRLEELSLLIGEELTGMLAPAELVMRGIDQAYFEQKREAVSGLKPSPTPAKPAPARDLVESRTDDLLRISDSAPVTQLVNGIILDAVRSKASDIHIEPFENHLRIRFRVDGFLYEQEAPPKHLEQAFISRLKVMSRLDISERRLPQDGMAKVRAGEREIDIRVSTVPVAEGERVVLRLLNQSSTLLPLGDLGMPPDFLRAFREVISIPHGIVLVTGPTGSGKTTTLYAALREIDTIHRNVMTIEDPIEYQMTNIGQIQVKPKIGLTFAAGLRHILRQDPDVILVGEIRDQETAEIAVRAALTGHLVFSTLHTNDAVSAVVRLADMGIQPYLIASSVRAVLAQRLVRRLCPDCRRIAAISERDVQGWPDHWRTKLIGQSGYLPVGCGACMQGYRGRIGVYELFLVGHAEQEEIRRSMNLPALRRLANAQGGGMAEDAIGKLRDGTTSLDEVRRVLEPASFSATA